jgi:ATP-binding cassette subfamily B protein
MVMTMKNNYFYNLVKGFLKESVWLSISLIVTIVLVVLVSLIPPQILKNIVDNYLNIGFGDKLLHLALIYFFVLLIIGLLDFVKEALLTIFGQKMSKNLRSTMMKKKSKLFAEYFSQNETGSIVSRYINDVDAIQSLFTNGIISMVIDALKIIGIVISIWFFSTSLGIIVICIIPVIYVISRQFQKKMLSSQMKNRVLIARVNNHIPESIKNIEMIKSFSKERYMESKYKEYLQDSYESMEKVNFYDSVFSPIILMIRAVVIAVMVILSSDSISLLGISVGMIAATIELISNIFSPIESLGMELQSIQQAISGVKRVNEFLSEEEINQKITDFSIKSLDGYEVVFDNVCFNYKDGQTILKNMSFEIANNENVIFTGRTGAGKSTLFKLILGLLEPKNGSITIGGVNVKLIPNSEKRKIFGYVEQSFHFVKGTIKDQITLGDNNISTEEVEKVIRFVGLHDYITNLENGYDTIVKDSLFSQGQAQLLSIARAMVTNPPIMLLDEITANLDSETEEHIIRVLQEAGSERTLLSISHRLSSVLKCDRLITIEKFVN